MLQNLLNMFKIFNNVERQLMHMDLEINLPSTSAIWTALVIVHAIRLWKPVGSFKLENNFVIPSTGNVRQEKFVWVPHQVF